MTTREDTAGQKGIDVDTALAAAAQGVAPTSDDADADGVLDDEGRREVDVIGVAAGAAIPDGEPLGGPDEIAKRDAHRWELDPASDEDLETREDTLRGPPVELRRHAPSSGER